MEQSQWDICAKLAEHQEQARMNVGRAQQGLHAIATRLEGDGEESEKIKVALSDLSCSIAKTVELLARNYTPLDHRRFSGLLVLCLGSIKAIVCTYRWQEFKARVFQGNSIETQFSEIASLLVADRQFQAQMKAALSACASEKAMDLVWKIIADVLKPLFDLYHTMGNAFSAICNYEFVSKYELRTLRPPLTWFVDETEAWKDLGHFSTNIKKLRGAGIDVDRQISEFLERAEMSLKAAEQEDLRENKHELIQDGFTFFLWASAAMTKFMTTYLEAEFPMGYSLDDTDFDMESGVGCLDFGAFAFLACF